MKIKIAVYDPPSGWMFGFPKPYKPKEGETLEQTLLRDGYSEKMLATIKGIDGHLYGIRFFETEEEINEDIQDGW